MARREYRTNEITVFWDSSRCIHTGVCLRTLPAVFDTKRRPWVDVSGATAEEIAAAVQKCPSGALRYEWADGTGEPVPERTTIVVKPGGPLWVRGDVEVQDAHRDTFDRGYRMTLCRCGHSKNQPFCDLSHRDVGFTDNPRVVTETRQDADHPGEVAG